MCDGFVLVDRQVVVTHICVQRVVVWCGSFLPLLFTYYLFDTLVFVMSYIVLSLMMNHSNFSFNSYFDVLIQVPFILTTKLIKSMH